ncbi:Arginine deiminase [Sporomusa aerivorans]
MRIPCIARCTEGYFERGDFWFLDEYTLVVGLVQRTDQAGFYSIVSQLEKLGYILIPVPCPQDNLHLDMCFNIAAEKVAVVCPEALPEPFLQNLKKRKFILIEVSQADVFHHHCNIQALGNGKVLSFHNNKMVNRQLSALGLDIVTVDLYEMLKCGGGPHCMTFPLKRA